METARLIVFPIALAAITQIDAVSVSAHSVRVQSNYPSRHTVRFARAKLPAGILEPNVSACNLADAVRVAAYRHGKPCARNLY